MPDEYTAALEQALGTIDDVLIEEEKGRIAQTYPLHQSSHLFVIETTTAKYFIKFQRGEQTIENELRGISTASSCSVPTPKVLYADAKGNDAGIPFLVTEYIEAKSIFDAIKGDHEIFLWGSTHHLDVGFMQSLYKHTLQYLEKLHFSTSHQETINSSFDFHSISQDINRYLKGDDQSFAFQYLENLVAYSIKHSTAFDDVPARPIHGDIYPPNVLYVPSKLPLFYLIDWGHFSHGDPAYDLARATITMTLDHPIPKETLEHACTPYIESDRTISQRLPYYVANTLLGIAIAYNKEHNMPVETMLNAFSL